MEPYTLKDPSKIYERVQDTFPDVQNQRLNNEQSWRFSEIRELSKIETAKT